MPQYIAFVTCDIGAYEPLEGMYTILKYTLEPCDIRVRSQYRGVSNFVIRFTFEGLPEKGLSESESVHNSFLNQQMAVQEAQLFIAWLSTATRSPLDLSHYGFGNARGFGPTSTELVDEFNRDRVVNIHHIKKDVPMGVCDQIHRPNYENVSYSSSSLNIPDDFEKLSKKLYALPKNYQKTFFDSCLSYQFALINQNIIPSVSLVALVNVVESLMRDNYSSGYCEETGKLCPSKGDVMKKFRTFFEENLQFPLPDDKRQFLNVVYRNRSNFVHKALMGSGSDRGPIYFGIGRDRALDAQISEFETLVNVGMINWLMRI